MNPLPKDELKTLIEDQVKPCLSLYMPAVRAGEETQQNPIRFKNLLREAEDRLVEAGLRRPEARELVQPAMEILNDEVFWQQQNEGLALFLSPDVFKMYRLPLQFEDRVIVTHRFFIKPLLPLYSYDGRFYLLALSQNEVRLFEGTRFSLNQIEDDDLPKSLAEALAWDDPERQLQVHPTKGATTGGDRPTPAFHGHAAGMDEAKEKNDILRYFHKVDAALRDELVGQRVPLVLAGVEYLLPIYREASDYAHLVEEGITGNPEELSAQELHERAWQILEPRFRREQEEAAALYRQQAGMESGRASEHITDIVPAAYYGRVGQLFIPLEIERWGTFDPDTGQVELQEGPNPENQDLYDFAAVHTCLNDGMVYAVQASQVPAASGCAAVFRY